MTREELKKLATHQPQIFKLTDIDEDSSKLEYTPEAQEWISTLKDWGCTFNFKEMTVTLPKSVWFKNIPNNLKTLYLYEFRYFYFNPFLCGGWSNGKWYFSKWIASFFLRYDKNGNASWFLKRRWKKIETRQKK